MVSVIPPVESIYGFLGVLFANSNARFRNLTSAGFQAEDSINDADT